VALSAAPKSPTALPRNSLSFDSSIAMVVSLNSGFNVGVINDNYKGYAAARVTATTSA
jgi:hypothetical protein